MNREVMDAMIRNLYLTLAHAPAESLSTAEADLLYSLSIHPAVQQRLTKQQYSEVNGK